VFALPAIYLLIAVGCLILSDRLIVTLMENIRTIGLSGEAAQGIPAMESEIEGLTREVARTDSVVTVLANRDLPTLQQLKELQNRHHLSLVQMERVSKSGNGTPGVIEYNTVLTGSVGGLIRFLQELETAHVVKSEQVLFRPARDDGSVVALGLSLTLREE
jgi:hypothetical protein